MSGVVKLRMAVPEDLQEIVALERSAQEAPHWSEAMWQGLLQAQTMMSARDVFVATVGDKVCGFVVVACLAGVAEIENIVVAFEERGQGIGADLCRRAIAWARECGALAMELEVRASNVAAAQLYRSLGFVEQGRRAGYYHDPEEDAVLMVLGIEGAAEGSSSKAKV